MFSWTGCTGQSACFAWFSTHGSRRSVSKLTNPGLTLNVGDDGWERQITDHVHGIRTQADDHVEASKALKKLKDGNLRYVAGEPQQRTFDSARRTSLAMHGQLPFAAIIGCADSRCPIEILFDMMPGDLFVLRNAGNTCSNATQSIIGSVEYSVGHLRTKLVLVLGHTKCGAIVGATACALEKQKKNCACKPNATSLETLLDDLGPVALKAQQTLPEGATLEEVANAAIKVNVFHTMENLLSNSKPLQEKVAAGEIEVHGALYDIVTGEVNFLGQSPEQKAILEAGGKSAGGAVQGA